MLLRCSSNQNRLHFPTISNLKSQLQQLCGQRVNNAGKKIRGQVEFHHLYIVCTVLLSYTAKQSMSEFANFSDPQVDMAMENCWVCPTPHSSCFAGASPLDWTISRKVESHSF